MKDFFLRARHYVLFIPLILPNVASLYFQFKYMKWISNFQQEVIAGANPVDYLYGFDLAEYRTTFLVFLLMYTIAVATQFGWWYRVSTGLRKYLPEGTNLKPKRFRIALVVAVLYTVFTIVGQLYAFEWAGDKIPGLLEIVSSEQAPDPEMMQGFISNFFKVWLMLLPVGVFGFAAMAYLAYYAGKTIRCIEEEKPVRGGAVAGYAILSFLLYIGIWILQPKIRRLLETGRMKDLQANVWEVK